MSIKAFMSLQLGQFRSKYSIIVKTTNILAPEDSTWPDAVPPVEGARLVEWFINGEWVHVGWLMPQIGNDE